MEQLVGGITAFPVRIIPFDLGRALTERDLERLRAVIAGRWQPAALTDRQQPILKGCRAAFRDGERFSGYLYENGMLVAVLKEPPLDLSDQYESFSVAYCEDRKRAHEQLSHWTHPASPFLRQMVDALRAEVAAHTPRGQALRPSALPGFEYDGLSYIMTLSLFSTLVSETIGGGFRQYPRWLKNNLYALLDPSVLYLEDSGKFVPSGPGENDAARLLRALEPPDDLIDYERHRHLDVYMSWSAVALIGQIQPADREEYITLEVQLQSDWFYVYCLEKSLDLVERPRKQEMIELQRQRYELDMLENRLYDFDDPSIPTRIVEVQKGLVATSGLDANITHLARRIQFVLEREHLSNELRQRRLGQSTEVLLFVVAFVQIAPILAEYGEYLFHGAGIAANALILGAGLLLLFLKE